MASLSNISWLRYCIFLYMSHKVLTACTDCYSVSRATYSGTSEDQLGNPAGSCGYGALEKNLNGGDVSASSSKLYRSGTGCGACYQVKCTDEDLCATEGVSVVITNNGEADKTDFILSRHAFSQLGLDQESNNQLAAMGTVTVLYRRISCKYPGKNLMIKIDENSNYPSYLAFVFVYQAGKKDVLVVDVCENRTLECKLRSQNHGAVWDVPSPPKGNLSIRFLVSDGDQEQWITAANVIPQKWEVGAIYDSGVQIED